MVYRRVGLLLMGLVCAAAQAQEQAPAVAQFQALEDTWSIALAHRDQFELENLLLPGMVDISAKAEIATRNQVIANALAGVPEPVVSVEQKVVNVRVVSDVAVVEGTYKLQLKEADRIRDERGVFTHVWERTKNTWGCVSAQRTAVVDRVEGGEHKAAPGKKSNAAEPFHIPLLMKGAPAQTPEQTPPTTGNPPQ